MAFDFSKMLPMMMASQGLSNLGSTLAALGGGGRRGAMLPQQPSVMNPNLLLMMQRQKAEEDKRRAMMEALPGMTAGMSPEMARMAQLAASTGEIGPFMSMYGTMHKPRYETDIYGRRINVTTGEPISGLTPEQAIAYKSMMKRAGRMQINLPGREAEKRVDAAVKLHDELSRGLAEAENLNNTLNEISTLAAEGGAETIGPMGFLARLGDAASEQARAAANRAGIDLDPQRYDVFQENATLAAQSAEMKSAILDAATAIARLDEPEGRLSDADIQRALQRIAANSGSVNQLQATVRRALKSSTSKMNTRIKNANEMFRAAKIGELPLYEEPGFEERTPSPAEPVRLRYNPDTDRFE